MSDLVDPERIEQIVGVRRHATEHWGRAHSGEQTVYVLHSKACRDSTPDLRTCPYSLALDQGIEGPANWFAWRDRQDQPVHLAIEDGYLAPGDEAKRGEQ